MSEQELIKKYFSRHQTACESVELSVGDDAAIVEPPKDSKLVVSTDTLNVDVHFYADCDPQALGHKSLAVNLSDMAAMGARPLWATLNISLPKINHHWLEGFSNGLYDLANKHNVKIVGGDITKGPLSITITIIGSLNKNQALLRSNCQEDDLIYVTGYIGDAAFGLKLAHDENREIDQDDRQYFLTQLYRPEPRLDASRLLVRIVHSAIDISDGFLLDLQQMLKMSSKGAEIDINKIPISVPMRKYMGKIFDLEDILTGGEDYQLIFTIKSEDQDKLESAFLEQNIMITEVGKIVKGSSILLMKDNNPISLPNRLGFDHFS